MLTQKEDSNTSSEDSEESDSEGGTVDTHSQG